MFAGCVKASRKSSRCQRTRGLPASSLCANVVGMAKRVPEISDLSTADLVKLGLSRSYAFELLKRGKKPSLGVAVRIEQQFGVPASAWTERSAAGAA